MKNPTKEQIIEALNKSGYLFEQEVADLLENMRFHVETSYAYVDTDTGKSREIDVRGLKEVLYDPNNKITVLIELLIECKDFGSPLVFIERNKNKSEKAYVNPREYIFPYPSYTVPVTEKSYQTINAFKYLKLADIHYYYKDEFKATQFSKIYGKGNDWFANHEGIYDLLILPQVKLLEERRKNIIPQDSSLQKNLIWLLFPMVVIRDQLYSNRILKESQELIEQNRISFIRNIDSSNLKGKYLIDFVTIAGLSDFIKNDITAFYTEIINKIQSDPQKFIKK